MNASSGQNEDKSGFAVGSNENSLSYTWPERSECEEKSFELEITGENWKSTDRIEQIVSFDRKKLHKSAEYHLRNLLNLKYYSETGMSADLIQKRFAE
jgi:hypothetical protein